MDKANSILPPGLEQLAVKQETKQASGELGQSEFLELMLTQIKHQDPLNPSESGEFLSQLAQFGTVNGITELQSSFESLASSLQSSQALQASTLVGRSVLIPSSVGQLENGQGLQGAIEISASTSNLNVTIQDAVGQVVRQIELGTHEAGLVNFTWDGLDSSGQAVTPGNYLVSAQATIDGEVTTQPTFVQAKVESVTLAKDGNGTLLNLQGLGSVQISDIKEVL